MNIASLASRFSQVAINPQPLPPGPDPYSAASRFNQVALNPQPLPPGPDPYSVASRLNQVALNPQPLPPGADAVTKAGIIIIGGNQVSFDDENYCGNGKIPLPHPGWPSSAALPNQQLIQGAVQFF
jgi:hypothetical protein